MVSTVASAKTTTAPGLVVLDPIQGLIDYVNVIKPYHTKIFEVDFEFVYTDYIMTTISDVMELMISGVSEALVSPMDPALYWYDPATMVFSVWNGTAWVVSPNTTVSTTMPLNPTLDSYWFNPTTDILYYWNGDPWIPIPINLIISNTPPFVTPPPPTFANELWYDPTIDTLFLRDQSNTYWIFLKTMYEADIASLVYFNTVHAITSPIPQVPSITADTTVTEFMEAIAFNWSGNNSYTIMSVNLGANQVTLMGNLTNAIMAQDVAEVVGSVGNPTILSTAYDPIANLTTVTVDLLPVTTIAGNTFIVQDIDVSPWFQFTIISVNPTDIAPSQSPNSFAQTNTNNVILGLQPGIVVPGVPSITVLGNATVPVQPGSVFQIQGSGGVCPSGNDGVYYAVYVQYEPIANTSTIGVGSTLGLTVLPCVATGGGMVVPYRFINEAMVGSYDNGGYDSGPYDE